MASKKPKVEETEVKQEQQTMRVFVFSDETVKVITDLLFQAPARDVIGTINEISNQLSNQSEVIKFIKEAEVTEAKAEA